MSGQRRDYSKGRAGAEASSHLAQLHFTRHQWIPCPGCGQRLQSFRRSWARACKKAGLEGRLVHDLRRTAAREFRRNGVSEGEIMRLCGWKTRAMFDRYNIIDEADLAQAVAKRFNGKQTANSQTPASSTGSLSSSAA